MKTAVVPHKPTQVKPAKDDEKAKWYDIGPSDADVFLNFNTEHNRPVDENHVVFLSNEMLFGRFIVNGDAIRIDREGRLIDGQHRLRAIIKSGVTMRMLVVENLEPEAFETIDQGGKARSVRDVLAINKERSVKGLATALSAIWRYEKYDFPAMSKKVSTRELLMVLEEYPELRDIAARSCTVTGATFLRGVPGTLLLFYGRNHPELLEQFWMGLQKGIDVHPNTGCYWLRERLIRMKTSAAVLKTPVLVALTIKAWNADVQQKEVRQLLWRSDEPFPRFV